MRTWQKVLIGSGSALVVLLVIAYFGMGYVIYDTLGNVKGSCDEHLANRPDRFALHSIGQSELLAAAARDAGVNVTTWFPEKRVEDR